MPIFRVKSVKIYTGQKKFTPVYSWLSWQISGMGTGPTQWRTISSLVTSSTPSLAEDLLFLKSWTVPFCLNLFKSLFNNFLRLGGEELISPQVWLHAAHSQEEILSFVTFAFFYSSGKPWAKCRQNHASWYHHKLFGDQPKTTGQRSNTCDDWGCHFPVLGHNPSSFHPFWSTRI